ncbi:MAG: ubiquinol-cytochrome c reductase iron-sulfur subunit [Fimbriimonadales bacterium]
MCENGCENCSNNGEYKSAQRRKFLGWIVGVLNVGVIAAVFGPVLGFVGAPLRRKKHEQWVPVISLDEFAEGETKEVSYEIPIKDGYLDTKRRYSLYMKRVGEQILALDPACTHLGCRVKFQANKNRYFCPCHGGVFDDDGNVVSGPPPKALEKFETKIENGQVMLLRKS